LNTTEGSDNNSTARSQNSDSGSKKLSLADYAKMRASRNTTPSKQESDSKPKAESGMTSKEPKNGDGLTLKFKLMTGQEKSETFTNYEMGYMNVG
jgi:hypothetical protein